MLYVNMMMIFKKQAVYVKEVEDSRWRGHRRKASQDCMKVDMKSFGLSHVDAQEKDDWRVRIKGVNFLTQFY